MRVLLRHSPSGYFYGGPHYWVSEPDQAADLKTIEQEQEAQRREGFQGIEIVQSPSYPECDWVQMLEQWREAEARGEAA